MNRRLLSTLILTMAFPYLAAAISPPEFQGTWKLNVEKSKFNSPAPKSQTVTVGSGKFTMDEVNADGKAVSWSFPDTPGELATISGLENSSVTTRVVNRHEITYKWKLGDAKVDGKAVLSKNGKLITYTSTGTDPAGKPYQDVTLYEKQ